MARADVQALIKRVSEANKILDTPIKAIDKKIEKPKAVEIASTPDTVIKEMPVVEVKGLNKQLEALVNREHKPDAKKQKLRQDTVDALTRIAAELNAKDALDLTPIIDLLSEIAKQQPANVDYTFTVNRDRNGFISTIDAKAGEQNV